MSLSKGLFMVASIILAFVFILFSYTANAQSATINYQGKLSDNTGAAVVDGDYNVRFWLFQNTGQATTSAIWTEELTGANQVSVVNGLFSVMLGSTTPLSSVDFNQTLYLGVEIGGTGAATWDGEMLPRKPLGTVPAAFQAEEANNAQTLGGIATTSFLRSDTADSMDAFLALTAGGSATDFLVTGTATTTNLVVGSDFISSLTGTGLIISGNALAVSSSSLNITLAGLGDTNLSGPADGDLFSYNGSEWVNVATSSLGFVDTGATDFLSLTDTPGSFNADRILFQSGAAVIDDADFAFAPSTNTLTLGGMTISDILTTHTGASTTTIPSNNPYAWTISTGVGVPPLFRIDTTTGQEFVNIGNGTGDVLIGDIGSGSNLVFEESSTISGQGANTITLGEAGDTFNVAASFFGIGTSSPSQPFTITTNTLLTGALLDRNYTAGTNGMVMQTTGTGVQWVATSTLGFDGGATDFLSLTDTPGSFTANRILFQTGSAVTDSADLTFDGTDLNLGISNGLAFGGTRMFYASTTNDSVAVGEGAGADLTNLTVGNVAIGTRAGTNASTSDADYNVFIGFEAGENSSKFANTLIGAQAGLNNTGTYNNIIGFTAGTGSSGLNNNIIGSETAQSNSGSESNIMGTRAGRFNTGSAVNLFGVRAGYNNTGSSVNLIGNRAGYFNGGTGVNAIGYYAGSNNVGDFSDFIGFDTAALMTASATVAIGGNALRGGAGSVFGGVSASTTNNIAIGFSAGYNVATGGDNNILIGYRAADSLTTGANNLIIGYDVEAPSNTADNQLNIGNIIFGTGVDGVGTTLSSGNVGIGTTSPSSKLDVWGDFRVGTGSTPTFLVDTARSAVTIGTDASRTLLNGTETALLTLSNNSSANALKAALILNEEGVGQFDAGEILFTRDSNSGDRAIGNIAFAGAGTIAGWTDVGDASAGHLRFSGNPTGLGGDSEYMRLTSVGNLGIGTTSPYAKLSVSGDLALTGGIYDNSAARGTAGMVMQTTGTGVQWVATSSLGIGGGANYFVAETDSPYDVSAMDLNGVVLSVLPQVALVSDLQFNSDGTVLYILDAFSRDVNAYNLSTPYDISTSVFSSVVLSVATEETEPTSFLFNNDGTALYVLGNTGDDINLYTLSVAYDISTATFDSIALDVSTEEGTPYEIIFNNTGTSLYLLGQTGQDITEYTLSVAYDISTATFDSIALDVSGEDLDPVDMVFDATGTKLYILGDSGNAIDEYDLSVAYDISTAVYTTFTISALDGTPRSLLFDNVGSSLYVVGAQEDEVNEYALPTPKVYVENADANFGIGTSTPGSKLTVDGNALFTGELIAQGQSVFAGTSTFSNTVNLSGSNANLSLGNNWISGNGDDSGIFVSTSGNVGVGTSSPISKLTVFGDQIIEGSNRYLNFGFGAGSAGYGFRDSNGTLQYKNDQGGWKGLGGNFDITSGDAFDVSLANSVGYIFDTTSQDTTPQDMMFNNNGTILYILGDDGNDINAYNLLTPYDIETATFDTIVLDISPQETQPAAFLYNNDGTALYILGDANQHLDLYNLSVPYDISSATFDSIVLNITAVENDPQDMIFNDDGTVLYILGNFNDRIFKYDLSTAYDISTAVYDTFVLDVTAQDANPRGLAFNKSGSVLYVVGLSNDDIYAYDLSTPFTISTASYTGVVLSLATAETFPTSMLFSERGDLFYVIGSDDDNVAKYTIDSATIDDTLYASELLNNFAVGTSTALSKLSVYGNQLLEGGNRYLNFGTVSGLSGYGLRDAGGVLQFRNEGGTWNEFGSEFSSLSGNAYDISKLTSSSSALDYSARFLFAQDTMFNNDGTSMYILEDNIIEEFTLSTPFDVDTATFDSRALTFTSQETNARGFTYNDDGTTLYIIGSAGDEVNSFTMSVPYDISTAIFDSIALDVSGQDGFPRDLLFNGDGTVLYVLGDTDDDINAYSLSTAYDISSATFTGVVLSVGVDTNQIFFNDDGASLYIASDNGVVVEYGLDVPYDISTAGGTTLVSGDLPSDVRAFFYNDTGSILYYTTYFTDIIIKHNIGNPLSDKVYLTDLAADMLIGTTTQFAKLTVQSSNSNDILSLIDWSGSSVLTVQNDGNVGIGTTTPQSKLSLQNLALDGAGISGLSQYLVTNNSVDAALQFGNYFNLNASNTATTTLVGSSYLLTDNTTFGNTVRGLEVQADRGSNTQGENTALSGFARTFGVRGFTSGDAGGSFEPAGGFFETGGSDQGNAIRGFSSSITSASLLSLFQDTSNFTGTGLQMNFGNTTGDFSSSTSRYLDFQNGGTTVFSVSAFGTTTIGDGTTNNMAGLQIGYGGICVDNDGTCIASTTGRITSVESQTGNSDLAEMYFSADDLESGQIVSLVGELSIERAIPGTDAPILGVVSTKPGLTLGFDDVSTRAGESGFPIALSGRVPVQLSTENGEVKAGDELMLSSLPGIAMKSDGTGTVVGIALEDFDEDRLYSDTFINQFGDDVAEPVFTPITTNTDPRINDGCYFGGGGTADAEPCVPLSTDTEFEQLLEANQLAEADSVLEAIEDLKYEDSETVTLDNGDQVQVGQIVMFVDRSQPELNQGQRDLLASLLSTTTLAVQVDEEEPETLMERLIALADGFVDGVLSVFRIQTTEICLTDDSGSTCVDRSTLNSLLEGNPVEEEVGDSSVTSPETDDGAVNDSTNEEESTATSTESGTDNTATSTTPVIDTEEEVGTTTGSSTVDQSPEETTEVEQSTDIEIVEEEQSEEAVEVAVVEDAELVEDIMDTETEPEVEEVVESVSVEGVI